MPDKPQNTLSGIIKKSPDNIDGYIPPGHGDTLNKRLIGPDSGSQHVEVILGQMASEGNAETHTHSDLDQILYMLEGRLRVITDVNEDIFDPGDLCLIPINVPHKVLCETDKAKFLVIYAPPKLKNNLE